MQLPDDVTFRWLTYDPAQAEAWTALLSPEEQRRLASYTLPKRQREFVLGRAAARLLLAERLGVAPARVALAVADDGAVEVVGAGRVRLSIAHSDGHAVAAVADRPIGVDLERIAPRHPSLPGFLLHPGEVAALEALPLDALHAPILYWTLKEASLKALRTGFRLSPKKLRLEIDLPAQAARVHVHDGRHLHAHFDERADCYLAVALEA